MIETEMYDLAGKLDKAANECEATAKLYQRNEAENNYWHGREVSYRSAAKEIRKVLDANSAANYAAWLVEP